MADDSDTIVIRKKWKRNRILWLHGLISGFVLGVAHSVTPAIVSPETFNFGAGLKKLVEVAVVSGILGAFTFLAKSPLPALPPEIETSTITNNEKAPLPPAAPTA